ncbi:MAG: hypothetical protein JRN22_00455 [Nitrososphaerota archaeon]|nr:hypothetical protein [Nitrososphaerota archaeon]
METVTDAYSAITTITMNGNYVVMAYFSPIPTPTPIPSPTPVTFTPIHIEGYTDTTSAPFTIPTNEWIIKWSYVQANEGVGALFSLFVYPRGDTINYVSTLSSYNDPRSQPNGSTYVYASPGDYYIEVLAANTLGWTVDILPP